jgi:MarR family transcriptional regulator for hemolysin
VTQVATPGPSILPASSDERRRALAIKLTVLARHMWLTFDQRADKIGLTRAKWSVVAEVASNPGATQRNIAAALQVTDVTAGRLIDRLCAEGFLERNPDPEDRRAYRVYTLPPAEPLLKELGMLADEHQRLAFAGLEEADLAELETLLDTISRNVGNGRGKPQGAAG